MITANILPGLVDRVFSAWPWYLTRASGFLAAGLLALLIVSGVGQVTGHMFRLLEPLAAWANHRRLGLALVTAVALHMLALLFDTYQKFTIASLIIPFISDYRPLYIGLGIVAFYLLIAITITSVFFDRSHPIVWKLTHYLSYAVLGLVFVHGLTSGTDLGVGLLRIIWFVGGGILAAVIIVRLRRRGSLN